jgi:predicted acyltransferase
LKLISDVRLPGVLQRIAIVYFVVSLLHLKTTQKTQIITGSVLLLGYWAVMTLIPVPGIGAANLEKGTNLASWIDSILLKGHMYRENSNLGSGRNFEYNSVNRKRNYRFINRANITN